MIFIHSVGKFIIPTIPNSIIFQRGRWLIHQPVMIYSMKMVKLTAGVAPHLRDINPWWSRSRNNALSPLEHNVLNSPYEETSFGGYYSGGSTGQQIFRMKNWTIRRILGFLFACGSTINGWEIFSTKTW